MNLLNISSKLDCNISVPGLLTLFFCLSAGKSALHWAAAVNNVEAAVVLLKNGANKDMQNNKVR